MDKNRLPAVAAAEANGWAPGTVLFSAEWRTPRTIEAIATKMVTLREHGKATNRVNSFPRDVHAQQRGPLSAGEIRELLSSTLHGPLPSTTMNRVFATLAVHMECLNQTNPHAHG